MDLDIPRPVAVYFYVGMRKEVSKNILFKPSRQGGEAIYQWYARRLGN